MSTPEKERPRRFLQRVILLDLEAGPEAREARRRRTRADAAIRVGACYRDREFDRRIGDGGRGHGGRGANRDGGLAKVLEEIVRGAPDARAVLGHNLLHHDLLVLRNRAPTTPLLELPVIDTLYLSPLAFPQNPYHHLIKGYKLNRDAENDPVADARLAGELFVDEWSELVRRERECPGLLGLYRFCFARAGDGMADQGGLARVLGSMGGEEMDREAAERVFLRIAEKRACTNAAQQAFASATNPTSTTAPAEPTGADILALAYAAAWLPVAGANSVVPQWVWRELPAVAALLHRLREVPCGRDGEPLCQYCKDIHDPRTQLTRYFGFTDFRPEPRAPDGRSLQERIVQCGMRGGSYLAVLPTGGGKSLCFQLPALVRNFQRGSLTVVLSPLQALMRDQVENLKRRGETPVRAAALYGLLTPLERGQVLREVASGDVSILYVAPEQLRNRSFRRAVLQREIGAWVFDEAHCLSKWGHDFRPDYLYACRAIREIARAQGRGDCVPPIACLTATAKKEVVDELCRHFADVLGVELEVFAGGVQRPNLSFAVEECHGGAKRGRVLELCAEALEEGGGSVLVYCATRSRAEAFAGFLGDDGLPAAAFHGGMNAAEKKATLDSFLRDDDPLRIVCATNAFGMGVDKPDVRLVVHADIPGTLENYLQEAGRAGRDQAPAHCVLLYDEADIESQFRLIKTSELRRRDMAQILRGLRKLGSRRGRATAGPASGAGALPVHRNGAQSFHVTPGELLRDDDVETSFDAEQRSADTLVRTAVSWLEKAEFVSRGLNQTSVFAGKPKLPSLTAANALMAERRTDPAQREVWQEIFAALLNADPDGGLSVDEIAGLPRVAEWLTVAAAAAAATDDSSRHGGDPASIRGSLLILEELSAMARAGLLQSGTNLTAFVKRSGAKTAQSVFAHVVAVEKTVLEVLPEQAPDAEDGSWQSVSLRRLNEELRRRGVVTTVDVLRGVLLFLAAPDERCLGGDVRFVLRPRSRDRYVARLSGTFAELRERVARRHALATVCLAVLTEKAKASREPGTEPLVDFTVDELIDATQRDLTLREVVVTTGLSPIERVLLFLHEQDCIILQRGLAIFRAAMTITVNPAKKGRRYTDADHALLREHYQQRTVQVHVMQRYAELFQRDHHGARCLVADYFELADAQFRARYFGEPGEAEAIERPVGVAAYRRIVDDLDHPVQQAIVTAPADENQLVLAGPGSGKTKVVVHRCAYLLRVLRVRRSAVLVLCFNRNTVLELRRRLRALLGGGANLGGLQIHTYDGLAMRIAGRSFVDGVGVGVGVGVGAGRDGDAGGLVDDRFAAIRAEACALLSGSGDAAKGEGAKGEGAKGEATGGVEADDLRDRLRRGYQYILVDEYQDIDASQYQLVSAIAGRNEKDKDARLSILAVGDDDQNIYSWRGSSVEFIRRFAADYGAKQYELSENYRSSANIIAVANRWIEQNKQRVKKEPIRIDRKRADAPRGEPVAVVRIAHGDQQVALVADTLVQWRDGGVGPDSGCDFNEIVVLAREWCPLMQLRVRCRKLDIPVRWARDDRINPWQVRETRRLLAKLADVDGGQVNAGDLSRMVTAVEADCGASVWTAYLAQLVEVFVADNGKGRAPVHVVVSFLRELMHEERQLAMVERGVFLGTVHQAKGLEFDRVLLLDSGWKNNHAQDDPEAVRRLFYVGMTRTRHELLVFSLADRPRSFATTVRGYGDEVALHDATAAVAESAPVAAQNLSLLDLDDLYLDYAGRKPEGHRTHAALGRIRTGDTLSFRREDSWALLVEPGSGQAVAALKQDVREKWFGRNVMEIRVLAMVRRTKEQSGEEHGAKCRVDEWEVPVVEVLWTV